MDRRTANLRQTSRSLPFVVLFLAVSASLANAADKKANRKAGPKTTPVASTLPAGTKLDGRALAQHIDEAIDARLARREGLLLAALRRRRVPPPRLPRPHRRHPARRQGRRPSSTASDADKRAKLIDELLASPDYGKHMADIWQSLLLPRNSDNRSSQLDPLT